MGTVNLDNRLNDPLFYSFHAVKLFIQDPPGFLGINGLKIISFPLNIHHNGKGSLGVAPLLGRYFIGLGNRQVPSGPETDIVRQRPSCTVHKIRNTLDTGQFHAVPCFFLIFIRDFLRWRVAGQQPLDHKLKESILCGELCPSPEGCLPYLVYCILAFFYGPRKPYMNMVFSQPFQKADKPSIDLQDILVDSPFLSFKLKGCPPYGIGKDTVGMMDKFSRLVVQDQDRMLRRTLRAAGVENFIGTFRNPGVLW